MKYNKSQISITLIVVLSFIMTQCSNNKETAPIDSESQEHQIHSEKETHIIKESAENTESTVTLGALISSFYDNNSIENTVFTKQQDYADFDFGLFKPLNPSKNNSKPNFTVFYNNDKIVKITKYDMGSCNYEMNVSYVKDCPILICKTFWKDIKHEKYENKLKGFFIINVEKRIPYFIALNTSFGNYQKDSLDLLNNVTSISYLDNKLNVNESFFYLNKALVFFVTCEYEEKGRNDMVFLVSKQFESLTKKSCDDILSVKLTMEEVYNRKFNSCKYSIGAIHKDIKDNLPSWYWNNQIY